MIVLKTLDNLLGRVFRFVSSACFTLVLVLFLYTVFLRWFKGIMPFLPSIQASSEIQEMCLVWGVFIASAELFRTNAHIVVDVIVANLGGTSLGKLLMMLTNALTIIFGSWVIIGAYTLISKTHLKMVYLPFSKGMCYACIPVCGAVMIIYAVKNILVIIRDWNKTA